MIVPSSVVQFIGFFVGITLLRVMVAGVYRNSIASKLPKPILQHILVPAGMKADKVRKLHENLWYTMWHTASFLMVLFAIKNDTWFNNIRQTWDFRWTFYDFPHPFTTATEALYLLELAFWSSCLLFVAVETVRKDFVEMIIHHLATIALIALSYAFSYHRIGFSILLVHDIGDIFLYSAKFFNYLSMKMMSTGLFVIFVVTFFVTRLLAFPCLVRTAWGPFTGYLEGARHFEIRGHLILPVLLGVLQLLHCQWFVLILKMLVDMLKKDNKHVEADIRSEDESCDNEDISSKKKK